MLIIPGGQTALSSRPALAADPPGQSANTGLSHPKKRSPKNCVTGPGVGGNVWLSRPLNREPLPVAYRI
jgi:hypothetical protein